MKLYAAVTLAAGMVRRIPYKLIEVPPQVQKTITNYATGAQLLGGSVALFFLILGAIQIIRGSRDSIASGKTRIVCTIVGAVVCAGGFVLKKWIDSLMGF